MILDKNERGFTLIEIMLGITLLALVILPMLSFFGNSARVIQQTDIRGKALLIAQQTIEGLKAVDFNELESKAEDLTNILTEDDNLDLSLAGYPVFTRKVRVSCDGDSNIKTIEVVISWDEAMHDLNLKTKITRR